LAPAHRRGAARLSRGDPDGASRLDPRPLRFRRRCRRLSAVPDAGSSRPVLASLASGACRGRGVRLGDDGGARQVDTAEPVRLIAAPIFGALFEIIAIATLWPGRRFAGSPTMQRSSTRANALALVPVVATMYLPIVGLLFLAGATWVAWLLIVAAGLPAAILAVRRIIANLVSPAEQELSEAASPACAVIAERAIRASLVIIAAVVLALAWDLDMAALAAQDTFLTRLVRGALDGVVVLLVADLIWQLVKVAIDRRLSRDDALDLADLPARRTSASAPASARCYRSCATSCWSR
jgi:hypothetical protein